MHNQKATLHPHRSFGEQSSGPGGQHPHGDPQCQPPGNPRCVPRLQSVVLDDLSISILQQVPDFFSFEFNYFCLFYLHFNNNEK